MHFESEKEKKLRISFFVFIEILKNTKSRRWLILENLKKGAACLPIRSPQAKAGLPRVWRQNNLQQR